MLVRQPIGSFSSHCSSALTVTFTDTVDFFVDNPSAFRYAGETATVAW